MKSITKDGLDSHLAFFTKFSKWLRVAHSFGVIQCMINFKEILTTAERADEKNNINSYIISRHMIGYVKAIPYLGSIVMELGSGNGYGMRRLSEHVDSYTAVDKYSSKKMQLTNNAAFFKAQLPKLDNIGCNMFNTIICFQVLEHIKEDATLIQEIYRILKPNGNLILTTPNKVKSLTRNPHHIREYDIESIKAIIGSQFKTTDYKGVFGNEKVLAYYAQNKKNIAQLTKWDIFNLQYRLPAFLLKPPYNILNNFNRIIINKASKTCEPITWNDFYIDEANEECLDFFVIANK